MELLFFRMLRGRPSPGLWECEQVDPERGGLHPELYTPEPPDPRPQVPDTLGEGGVVGAAVAKLKVGRTPCVVKGPAAVVSSSVAKAPCPSPHAFESLAVTPPCRKASLPDPVVLRSHRGGLLVP